MAKSIHVINIGSKQKYNLWDPESVHRAQKAINERITQMAKTFGTESQVYRDYIAPLTTHGAAKYVRLSEAGLTKFRTGKGTRETLGDMAEVRDLLERMLPKATHADLLARTAEQMGYDMPKLALKDPGIRATVVKKVKTNKEMEEYIYSRLNELYEYADKISTMGGTETKGKILKKTYKSKVSKKKLADSGRGRLGDMKWYKTLKESHGKPSEEAIQKAYNYLRSNEDRKIFKMEKL